MLSRLPRPSACPLAQVLWELLTWQIPWGKAIPWLVVGQLMNGAGGRLTIPPTDTPADLAALPGLPADNAAFAPHLPAFVALIRCAGRAVVGQGLAGLHVSHPQLAIAAQRQGRPPPPCRSHAAASTPLRHLQALLGAGPGRTPRLCRGHSRAAAACRGGHATAAGRAAGLGRAACQQQWRPRGQLGVRRRREPRRMLISPPH